MLLLAVALSIVVLAIPLMLGKVPRNHWYGFRIERTMVSDEAWYRANRIGGRYYLFAGLAMLAAVLVAPAWVVAEWPELVVVLPLAVATGLWYWRVRRL
jgi:uncharacterized membrane protein